MKGLKDNADVAAAKARQRVFVELPQVGACDHDGAGVRLFQAGQHHEQRGLAGAGWPHQADCLAAAYIESNVLEDMDTGGGVAERKIDAGERDGRA